MTDIVVMHCFHSSQAVLMLSGFHLAINWDWALAAGQKVFRRVREGAL